MHTSKHFVLTNFHNVQKLSRKEEGKLPAGMLGFWDFFLNPETVVIYSHQFPQAGCLMTCLVGTSNVYALMWFLRSTVVYKDGPVMAFGGLSSCSLVQIPSKCISCTSFFGFNFDVRYFRKQFFSWIKNSSLFNTFLKYLNDALLFDGSVPLESELIQIKLQQKWLMWLVMHSNQSVIKSE